MTKYYFVRHGEDDRSEEDTKIYKGNGCNMLTLSNNGIEQIKETSKDPRLKNAKLIVTSPFGRALHSSAILSKELGIDIVVETDLHEWVADADYNYLAPEDAMQSLREFCENRGCKNANSKYNYETLESLIERVSKVLDKYKDYDEVIVVCHGLLIQCFLGVEHPHNGEIFEYVR